MHNSYNNNSSDTSNNICPLLLPNELNKLYKDSECFKLMCLNIRSFPKHHEDLTNLLSTFSFDFSCIVLTETYLKDYNKDLFDLANYDLLCACRKEKRGGGISVCIKKDLKAKVTLSIVNKDIEALAVTYNEGTKKFNLLGIYRPPQGSKTNFVKTLDEICSTTLKNGTSLIAGDFNIDVSNNATIPYHTNSLIDTMTSNGYENYITSITRPKAHQTSTIIDHIWSNKQDSIKSYTLYSDISDHYPCVLMLETPTTSKEQKEIALRLVSDDRKNKFLNQIKTVDFSFLHSANVSIDEKFKLFNQNFYSIYDKHFPIKYKTATEKIIMNKWLTKALLNSIKQKQKLYKSAKRGIIPMQTFIAYSSLLKKLIRKSKANYFENKFQQTQNDAKSTWGLINNILNCHKNNEVIIPEIKVKDETVTDKKLIVNELNSYFTTIGAKVAAKIPQTSVSSTDYLETHKGQKFSFTNITSSEVKCAINSLKNKTSDIHSVPNWIYKYCANEISPLLAILHNTSLEIGHFPEELKIVRVTPVPKSIDTYVPNNFRPISILHTFGKLFEKLVHTQLINNFSANELLSQTQFGFTKNRNTEAALTLLTENIYKALNDKQTCILLLLDFSKAFDVVPHNLLLQKLNRLGVSKDSINWFQSYLSGRTQYVKLGDVSSSLAPISQGVPHGSILGPLFFNMYTNDFQNCHDSLHSQYADDTAILIIDRNIDTLNTKVNNVLENIVTWVEANRLSLNLQKTQYLMMTNIKSPIILNVMAKGTTINRTTSAKLLGVIFDEKLSFKNHINSLISKLAYATYAFLKIRNTIPRYILKNLYYSLVYPHLLYNLPVWGCASEYLLQPLIKLHKKIIRIISGTRNHYQHTSPLFKQLSILKLQDMLTLTMTTQIFKIINGLSNKLFSKLIMNNHNVRRLNLRSKCSHKLSKTMYTLTKSRRAISYKGIEKWNDLPKNIQELATLPTFRKHVKNHLLSKY
ncbi:UNVERIFIED_CONTAM: hypothetical protein RMT77_018738 [Armadillidium vulgare]